ncbi:acyloxyacyl hydrolase [Pseudomonas mohnii]|nr:acyloxyacyl hydrolase [Pseudomonas mohnii]
MKRLFCLAAIAAALMGHSFTAQAAGVEFGIGQTSDSTMTYRLGMQFDWDKSWWQSDVGRLTGYWSGAYTYWEGNKSASNNSLSFSPVFVYEFAGQSVKPYVELGVGVAFFTNTQVEDNHLGSVFQFEDRFGCRGPLWEPASSHRGWHIQRYAVEMPWRSSMHSGAPISNSRQISGRFS